MKYTINGKEWAESNIKLKCAALMNYTVQRFWKNKYIYIVNYKEYDPCNNPSDTDSIINKCFNELLMHVGFDGHEDPDYDEASFTRWEYLINKHNCTKLVAACICYIEINEAAL